MENARLIASALAETATVKRSMAEDPQLIEQVSAVVDLCCKALTGGGRVLWCGNGGSAADAMHLAAELSGRFYLDRRALDSESLGTNLAYLTAVSNDYSFGITFARLISAKGRPGDVLVALSTSGNSPNVVEAAQAARSSKLVAVGLTGSELCGLDEVCDVVIHVPSTDTPRIQEAQMVIGHTICQLVESALFQPQAKPR